MVVEPGASFTPLAWQQIKTKQIQTATGSSLIAFLLGCGRYMTKYAGAV